MKRTITACAFASPQDDTRTTERWPSSGPLCLFLAVLATGPAFATEPYSVSFEPRVSRFVRVVIQETSRGQPCIDEFEVFGPGATNNVALASLGARASASSALSGRPIHRIEHLNDGRYGNSNSWIAAAAGEQWAQIELPRPTPINRLHLSRDRQGRYHDRIPTKVAVQLSDNGIAWKTVALMTNRAFLPQPPPYIPPAPLPDPVTWQGLLKYAFLCERATWQRIDPDDHISPLSVERAAAPGGTPYWGHIARLQPAQRVLAQMADMLHRIAAKGIDVSHDLKRFHDLAARASEDRLAFYLEARLAKRRLMFRDPELEPLRRILFVKRHPYLSSHNYSDVLDSKFRPGGGICALEIPRVHGRLEPGLAKLRTLFDASDGIARDPVASFDGKTFFFAYRPGKDSASEGGPYWHLWAVDADGTRPRQITFGPFHDYYPCPLPDGGLAFISTRCRARFLCWRPQAFVLFRMDADGRDLRPLSYANLSEWSPAVMRDGRILWTRSEYLDKGADFGHTLWAVRPDGTHPELIFGNNTPNCYINGREVPDSREILCTLFSHGGDHNGPLGLIDMASSNHPSDTNAVTNITPDTRPHYNMSWPRHECWRDPVPITRDYFLASHAPANRFGLYVIDRYGNRELLYLDPDIGSMTPSIIGPVSPPPALVNPTARVAESADGKSDATSGQFLVADIYQGLSPEIPRGKVKFIRVCQEVRADLTRLPDGSYRADHQSFQDWYATPVHKVSGPNGWPTYVAKAPLGLAPVEEDGSANFLVPAGKVLYFQALDENLNELQRMRSVVQLQPSEQRGCIGCHEHRLSAAPVRPVAAARRPPSNIEPPPWGPAPFSYETVVQPVFDAHCVRCHDASHPGKINLTGKLDAERVPASYRTLIEGGYVHYFDMTYKLRHGKAGPASFGVLRSRLGGILDGRHHDVRLDRDEKHAVKCWIDLNCPLWPDYQFRPERRPSLANSASPSGP